MHRFRKKSDVKRSPLPDYLPSSESSEVGPLPDLPVLPPPTRYNRGASHSPYSSQPLTLTELPPASDFRTSLILPDLTRRFTLLRTPSGEAVPLDELRTRFAEQRARGSENQITEQEEDMLFETLRSIRGVSGQAKLKRSEVDAEEEGNVDVADSGYQASVSQRSPTVTASPSSSTRSTKRHSNNLFGSGRFRDYSYMRGMTQRYSKTTASIAPTESTLSMTGDNASYSDIFRPVTPDSGGTSSVQSTPEKMPSVRSAALMVPDLHANQIGPTSVAEYRLSQTLGPAGFKRASLAFEEVIREMALIEEEADDEIVMPRTAPAQRSTFRHEQRRWARDRADTVPTPVGAGTAISSDKEVIEDPEPLGTSPLPNGRPGTISPSPRLPGYIPGMPRPMTPRDSPFESDDQLSRANSTTPRAASPITERSSHVHSPPRASSFGGTPRLPVTLPSNIGSGRVTSNISMTRQQSSRPTSATSSTPLYLSRSTNGRFTPTDDPNGANFSKNDGVLSSPIIGGRRRPASPLTESTYQPMAVSSRPGTPSNVTWSSPSIVTLSPAHDTGTGSHHRNGSWVSENGQNVHGSVLQNSLDQTKSTTPSLSSPALPDSPLMVETDQAQGLKLQGNRPPSARSPVDLGSLVVLQSSVLRSPTPTQSTPQSPTSATFSNAQPTSSIIDSSRRSSKQNGPSSPFTLSPTPLVFSPIANSSRSSLESAGSSYHSWDAGFRKDHGIDMFISDIETQDTPWHSVGSTDRSNSVMRGDSLEAGTDVEDVIERYAGLTKTDFLAIQEKLVGAAIANAATPAPRDRVPSLRRRRPSTSQSNYSINGHDINRVASPPQVQNSVTPETCSARIDNSSKASALLDSVVESIQSPLNLSHGFDNDDGTPRVSHSDIESSSSSRRNRDLADVLFGPQDDLNGPPSELSVSSPRLGGPPVSLGQSYAPPIGSSILRDHSNSSFGGQTSSTLTPTSPYLLRSPMTPKSPQSTSSHAELAREVQRKTDAAMAQLKRSPTLPDRQGAGQSISRKRTINPNQISNPQLVSATTSVDTIPLQRSPSDVSGQQASKISLRIKKLRETLLPKQAVPDGNEITPYPINPIDLQSPPAIQTARYDHPNQPAIHSSTDATELERFDAHQVPSPPASAGPGLRGFMARFRKQRTNNSPPEHELRGRLHNHSISMSPSSSPQGASIPEHAFSAPATRESFEMPSSRTLPHARPPRLPPPKNLRSELDTRADEPNDEDQRRKLFEAASNLGVDPSALNDLLSRSAPITRETLNVTKPRHLPQVGTENGLDTSKSLTAPSGRLGSSQQAEELPVRRRSYRARGDQARTTPSGQGDMTENAIVRRTLIFPSERSSTLDLNLFTRKSSTTRRRRSTTGSVTSSRSVHDRAPTPPPPRSPTSKRFSNNLPPVPQLPPSLSAQSESMLHVTHSTGPIEKSSSTYDSLYEMYAGESKPSVSSSNGSNASGLYLQSVNSDTITQSESGPALEVIELANGETIWSIVNGLRDDDVESVYANRASFASEYSAQEAGLQLRFKEHGRSDSKGSNASLVSSSMSPPRGYPRPDTKVFYSSSAEIGRLIENISHNMEAGSFNLLPTASTTCYSSPPSVNSGAEMDWTVEERLDHMLGSLGS